MLAVFAHTWRAIKTNYNVISMPTSARMMFVFG